jgi:ribosomal protein S18 acetylase RimI-like enzyme
MQQAQIRYAQLDDAESASRLAWRAKSGWGYSTEWLELWRQSLTITSEYMRAHESFVAVEGEQLVGVCILESRGGEGALERLWIEPAYQRQGIGRALVERALASAASGGLSRVQVESDPFAEAFYTGLGARRVGLRPAPMPGAPERTLPLLEFTLADLPDAAKIEQAC